VEIIGACIECLPASANLLATVSVAITFLGLAIYRTA
jgi:hypothetical protein